MNPLRQDWVLVSPHRTQRPWLGEIGQKAAPSAVTYDPECYLCPGNTRAGGAVNPKYEGVFSFVNDYAALLPEAAADTDAASSPLLASAAARGLCKVLCYHPDHSLTLARMTREEIRTVVDAWTEEFKQLRALGVDRVCANLREPRRNDGREQSAPSLPDLVDGFRPDEPAAEWKAQREYFNKNGCCLLCDYLKAEQ